MGRALCVAAVWLFLHQAVSSAGEVDQHRAELDLQKSQLARLKKTIDQVKDEDVPQIRNTIGQLRILDLQQLKQAIGELRDDLKDIRTQLADMAKRVKVLSDAACAGPAAPAQKPTTTAPNPAEATAQQKPMLTLEHWGYEVRKNELGFTVYRMTIVLKNAYPKDIKLIDAGIYFSDLLGAGLSVRARPE